MWWFFTPNPPPHPHPPALPPSFKQKLKNQVATEGQNVTLSCELSKPGVKVQWKKGSENLQAGDKYEMKQRDSSLELQVKTLKVEDSGEYCCECGDQKTTATVKVNGMNVLTVSLRSLF